jgi:hypothetical protein
MNKMLPAIARVNDTKLVKENKLSINSLGNKIE